MGLRFETNFIRLAGLAPFPPADTNPLQRWIRVHEWNVDAGFTSRLMGIMLNVETLFAPTGTQDFGFMRVDAMLDVNAKNFVTKFETKMASATPSAKCNWTPRLVILPIGDGITLTAGQGLATKALGGSTSVFRWWSCYVTEANPT